MKIASITRKIPDLAQSLFFDDFCTEMKFQTTKKGRPREILKKCPTEIFRFSRGLPGLG